MFRPYWKALEKHYKTTKIFGPKYKNKKVLGGQILMIILIFSKLVNFGPNTLTFFESLREGYKSSKFFAGQSSKAKSY